MIIYVPDSIRPYNPGFPDKVLSRYIDNVWRDCEAMRPGDKWIISEIAENHPDLFVACVKNYMDEHDNQDGISFNNEKCEVLRKTDVSLLQK